MGKILKLEPSKILRSIKTLGMTGVLISLIALSGCSIDYTDGDHHRAAVYDRSYKSKSKSKTSSKRWQHIVEQGESLYSISVRYGRDFRELAALNNIEKPYTIVPGQKIFLDRRTYDTLNTKNDQTNSEKNTQKSTTQDAAGNNNIEIKQYVKPGKWIWPVYGKVMRPNDGQGKFNNGIDIAVKTTTPVRACAAGKVVYQGAGLKGYGKLIIIKHSEEYLSAYAHNDWLLVNEGQWVNQGQQIAYIGQQYEKKLHFQIRKNGKPVDPLVYLPNSST